MKEPERRMAEIPVQFIMSHPTLCGEALVEAWEAESKELADWFQWHKRVWKTMDTGEADEWWAAAILARLRELGYRKPDHSPDAGKVADARCWQCKGEFVWSEAPFQKGGDADDDFFRYCPDCRQMLNKEIANAEFSAAHPPAETPTHKAVTGTRNVLVMGTPAETNSPKSSDSSDELAMELFDIWATEAGHRLGYDAQSNRAKAGCIAQAHRVRRREREAELRALEWAFSDDVGNKEIQDRIAELKAEGE